MSLPPPPLLVLLKCLWFSGVLSEGKGLAGLCLFSNEAHTPSGLEMRVFGGDGMLSSLKSLLHVTKLCSSPPRHTLEGIFSLLRILISSALLC